MRVLIVKVSSLGDIIHTLPAVTDARMARGDVVFDWVVEEDFAEIPRWHSAVNKVIPVAFRRWRHNLVKTAFNGEFRDFASSLRNTHYDLVIDAQGLIKSGIISRISNGITIGLSNRTIREPWATLFYNKVYSVPWTEHAVSRVRQLFGRALNYRFDKYHVNYGLEPVRMGLPHIERPKPSIVFLHGTTWDTKHLPVRYWRRLANIATDSGYDVLLPWGSEAERQRACYIADRNESVVVLEKLTLTGLAGYLRQAAGVISVDTGLSHLSVALALPTVSLYGPTDPRRAGTFGNGVTHITSNLNCSPCLRKTCGYKGSPVMEQGDGEPWQITPPCFASHKPEFVWQQFESLLPR